MSANHKNKKSILFDYDGVIVDTLPAYAGTVTELAHQFGNKREITEEIIRERWGGGWQSLYEHTLGIPKANVGKAIDLYRSLMQNQPHSPLFEGMREAIEELSRDYRLFIITASKTSDVFETLKFYGITVFEDVCGQDLLPNIRKGDPRYFSEPMQKWGISPGDAMSIGDTVDEISMGKKMGIATVACAWGWQSTDLLKGANPDTIIESPHQLPAAVRALLPV
ncbi:MAG: HAD family hydrolase [Candidatus Paceibacterota bacterium]|jgi:phosphoglycolate phosphatase